MLVLGALLVLGAVSVAFLTWLIGSTSAFAARSGAEADDIVLQMIGASVCAGIMLLSGLGLSAAGAIGLFRGRG